MNPIDVLGVHPTGALPRPEDPRDYEYGSPEIGFAAAPFDWDKGYDVEAELDFKVPTKDQGASGSCGGQTIGGYEMPLAYSLFNELSEKSAKAPYSQVFVPGGGSNSRMLGDIVVKQGFYKESLVPSYENGQPPSEAFMERPGDISAAAKLDAAKTKGTVAYSFPAMTIDAMAAAMRDNKGILIGIHGSNNGTWLSSAPSPKQVGDLWAHFMYGGKAKLVNGKKTLVAKQSWGKDAAPDTDGWQELNEDHWSAGRIWDAMVLTPSSAPIAPPHHTFNTTLLYGENSSEVLALQQTLAHDGVFSVPPTGYYGDITALSILKFRVKHGIDTSSDPRGHSVGPLTRLALNAIS